MGNLISITEYEGIVGDDEGNSFLLLGECIISFQTTLCYLYTSLRIKYRFLTAFLTYIFDGNYLLNIQQIFWSKTFSMEAPIEWGDVEFYLKLTDFLENNSTITLLKPLPNSHFLQAPISRFLT